MKSDSLKNLFQRVVVINLDRRPERWQIFLKNLPSDWPFGRPLRFSAMDGTKISLPSWWKEGAGAWGCYLSHRQLLQDAREDKIESILVLEDDAVFAPGFANDVRRFISSLPDDWQFLFLGGQHIELHTGLPKRVNESVYQPFNVNRMHAYAIRTNEMLDRVAHHFDDVDNWTAKHHVDHHLGDLQKSTSACGMYVPRKWLVGQTGGDSDIANQRFGFRTFQGAEDIVDPKVTLPMVAVLGPYSGGTSAVSGTLHYLGIRMGRVFEVPDKTNAGGHFEAHELASLCRRMFAEPWLTERVAAPQRAHLLRIWASGHCRNFQDSCTIVGGKQPMLCMMGPELMQAWNRPYFISVERDLTEVFNSLVRRNWGWPLEACMLVSQQLIQSREAFLATTDAAVLRLPYNGLVKDTQGWIKKICDFLQFEPTEEAVKRATEFVVPR